MSAAPTLTDEQLATLAEALTPKHGEGVVLPGKSYSMEVLMGGPVEESEPIVFDYDNDPTLQVTPPAERDPIDILREMQAEEFKTAWAQTPGSPDRAKHEAMAGALQSALDVLQAQAEKADKKSRFSR